MADIVNKAISLLRGKKTAAAEAEKMPVFDEADYIASYPDVAAAVKAGAFATGEAHYILHGYSEGRVAKGSTRPAPLNFPFGKDVHATRRDKMLANLDVANLKGLEIGPLSSPQVTHDEGSIIYVDHVDTETLFKKYGHDASVDKSKIVHVDAVWGVQSLQECIGLQKKVDYVVASHVIEHVPDLITWLAEIRSILRDSGSLRLAIPDKRYSFDILRCDTKLHDVLDAYLQRARKPVARLILEHFGNARIVDCASAWAGNLDISNLKPYHSWSEAIAIAKDSLLSENYHDSHCWIFTPVSFVKLCEVMASQGLLHFRCDYLIETPKNELEFYANLSPCEDVEQNILSWQRIADQLHNSKMYQH